MCQNEVGLPCPDAVKLTLMCQNEVDLPCPDAVILTLMCQNEVDLPCSDAVILTLMCQNEVDLPCSDAVILTLMCQSEVDLPCSDAACHCGQRGPHHARLQWLQLWLSWQPLGDCSSWRDCTEWIQALLWGLTNDHVTVWLPVPDVKPSFVS